MKVNPVPQAGVPGGADQEVTLHRDDVIKTFHQSEASAIQGAQKEAIENYGHQYAVMGIVKIFEVAKPVFIEKAINEAGEIVVVKGT